MTTANLPQPGDEVICADNEPLGLVDGIESTHLRVRRPHERPEVVWVPVRAIGAREEGIVRLVLDRDQLHDGVIALPPSRQREYGTLGSLSLLLQRQQGQHAEPAAPR